MDIIICGQQQQQCINTATTAPSWDFELHWIWMVMYRSKCVLLLGAVALSVGCLSFNSLFGVANKNASLLVVNDGWEKTMKATRQSAARIIPEDGAAQSLTSLIAETNKTGRFPSYGTAEFDRRCQWAIHKSSSRSSPNSDNGNCTILVRPPPAYNEGISAWIGLVVSGFLLAQQANCRLLIDYGPGIGIEDVLKPNDVFDWRVPTGFDCDGDARCFYAEASYSKAPEGLSFHEPHNFSAIPSYRHAFKSSAAFVSSMDGFRGLQQAFPGFKLHTGMACSLGSLFQLAPSATLYQSDLFSRILPALHAADVLVVSLYIRTGKAEQIGGNWTDNGRKYATYRKRAKQTAACALQVEAQALINKTYSNVIWMVVTDSTFAKDFIKQSYGGEQRTNATGNVYTREIITTQSRGAHSKPSRSPSTADFAEAFIDWYLIGESDVVVSDNMSPSFGDTAATRTTRPYYKMVIAQPIGVPVCEKHEPSLK